MKHILLTLLSFSSIMASSFTLESNDLEGQLSINQEFNSFGCSGKNMSPELHWKNPPKGTKSFAITAYDPDAPTGSGWWHWLVVNIPSTAKSIQTDASNKGNLPKGSMETLTDFGSATFGGACPPKGAKPHAYVFTIYALDVEELSVKKKSDSALVGFMINQHIIQKSTIISYYQR